MSIKKELHIKNPKEVYKELSNFLYKYADSPAGSYLFIVEGTVKKPIMAIRYPGKKVRKREVKKITKSSCLWANMLDFEVVVYENGKELGSKDFTFSKIAEDYDKNKKGNKEFWSCLEELFKTDEVKRSIPKLPGIDSELFLLAVKWIWIQEDLNYRLNWEETCSPVKYRLESKKGNSVSGGAGRKRFYAFLRLLDWFDFKTVCKIITPR